MLSNEFENRRLVRIANGSFVEKLQTNDSSEPNEQTFNRLDGYLQSITEVTTEYGRSIVLTFRDTDLEQPTEIVDLYLNENSRYVFDLFNRFPNLLNREKMICIKPYDIVEQEKTSKLAVIYQDGKKIERYFSREKVNELKLPAVATTDGYEFIPRLNSMLFYGCLFLKDFTDIKTRDTIKNLFDYMKHNAPGSIKHILSDLQISDTELTEIEISYNLRNNTVENPGNEQSENSDDIPF
jgi:hypothetical protein